MSNVQPNPGDARDLRQLLQAILEAVTLPHGTLEHARRMETRADWVRTTIKGALAEDPSGIGWHADFLRGRLAAEEREAAARAAQASVDRAFPTVARFLADEHAKPVDRCGRCRWTFDPHDKRFDGHARHADSPFCRRCVDQCHDGGTQHVCIICDPKRYGGAR